MLLHLCAGVYLPLLWDSSFCWHTPIALAYTRGHFSALVSMASSQTSEAGVWSNRSCYSHVTYLPLVDSEGRMLPIHFLTEQEVEPISSLQLDKTNSHSSSSSFSLSLSLSLSLHSWVVRSVSLVSTVTVTSLGLAHWQQFKRSQNSSNLPYLFNSLTSGWTAFAEWTNDVRWLHALTILIARSKSRFFSFCPSMFPPSPNTIPQCHS